jgi:hypothetical protein
LQRSVHPFHATLGLWAVGEDEFDAQLPHRPPKLRLRLLSDVNGSVLDIDI